MPATARSRSPLRSLRGAPRPADSAADASSFASFARATSTSTCAVGPARPRAGGHMLRRRLPPRPAAVAAVVSGAATTAGASARTVATARPPCAARAGSSRIAATARSRAWRRDRSSCATRSVTGGWCSTPASSTSPATGRSVVTRGARPAVSAGLGALVVALLAFATGIATERSGALDGVERETLKARFDVRGPKRPDDVAVVAIDAKTFGDLDRQWPFPRSLHARAIRRLHQAGARQIVYDVQF